MIRGYVDPRFIFHNDPLGQVDISHSFFYQYFLSRVNLKSTFFFTWNHFKGNKNICICLHLISAIEWTLNESYLKLHLSLLCPVRLLANILNVCILLSTATSVYEEATIC